MINKSKNNNALTLLLAIVGVLSNLSVASAQSAPIQFKISPSAIPAGRTRVVRIAAEPKVDLSDFEVEKPPEDTGILFDEQGAQLSDDKQAIVVRIKVDEDADEQVFPLTVVRKENGTVTERYTADLTVTEFRVRPIRKQAVPPELEFSVDSMSQPLSYKATKDIFGRRVADAYYAIVVGLGNNTGFDLQINKVGFVTLMPISVPDLDDRKQPVVVNGQLKTRYELLEIAAVDRTLVRSSIERDQSIGRRALALNLIGGIGTVTTGFLPFFHALGPRANFSSFTSVINGQLKDGFTQAVPDFTIRHLNRLDNDLVMDQDFLLPNNSERNSVVFIPRNALALDKDHTDDHKDHRDDLRMVKERLGGLTIVGRKIERFANRQIVVRSGVSGETSRTGVSRSIPSPAPTPSPVPPAAPVTIDSVTPDFGTLSEAKEVIITGSGFSPGTEVKVKFGDRQTTGIALSPTTVKATVPPIATAGPIDVEVVVNDNRKATRKDGYSYIDELKIDSVDPATGPVAAGIPFRILGRGFLSGAEVKVGGVDATNVTVSNDHTFLTATLPAHAAGVVSIVVKNPNGKNFSLANGFTYTQ